MQCCYAQELSLSWFTIQQCSRWYTQAFEVVSRWSQLATQRPTTLRSKDKMKSSLPHGSQVSMPITFLVMQWASTFHFGGSSGSQSKNSEQSIGRHTSRMEAIHVHWATFSKSISNTQPSFTTEITTSPRATLSTREMEVSKTDWAKVPLQYS